MAKLLLALFVALLAVSFVMACSPPGVMCTSNEDCCAPFICNPWAMRCTGGPGMPGGNPGEAPADEQ